MGVINSVFETPHVISSSGYMPLALEHPHTGPAPLGAGEPAPARRRRIKGQAKARKREVARGAGFLETLTTVRHGNFGAGVNQGAGAPSRRNMGARIE
jgi:hypothetical protein